MSIDIRNLAYGRIIWARVRDRHGYDKTRPCIILTPSARIAIEEPLLVMAITTSFADPTPQWHVLLPWNVDPRRVSTRLSKRSAAVIGWLDKIRVEDVADVKGEVPARQMAEIEKLQARFLDERGLRER